MTTSSARPRRDRSPDFLLRCIQLSGFTAIGYEMLWVRRFSFFLGSTAQVFSTILVAVLLGIAIGAWAFARFGRRYATSLARYGVLELLVAASAVAAYFGSGAILEALARALPVEQGMVTWVGAFAATVLLTGTSCTLIGASLPWLTRLLEEAHGDAVAARAYAFYNLGSALSALLVGSVLFVFVGYRATCLLLAAANAALGLYFLSSGARGAEPAREDETAVRSRPLPFPALVLISLLGFLTMFVETLHGQLLDYLLGGTRVGISATLATYFLAVSLGAVYARRLPRAGEAGLLRRSILLQASALFGLGGICFLPQPGAGFVESKLLASVVLALYFVFSFANGLQFPLLVRHVAPRGERAFAQVFYTETFAAILGTLVFAFGTLRWVGTEGSLLVALALTAAAAMLVPGPGRRVVGGMLAALVVGLLLAFPRHDTRTIARAAIAMLEGGDAILYHQEDANGLLLVVRRSTGETEIRNAYHVSGSTDIVRKNTQVLQGLLAASFLGDGARVLQIGYGNGQITRTIQSARPALHDVVELHPDMIPVSARFFSPDGKPPERNGRTFIQDGVAFVQTCRESYDLVLSDSFIISSELSTKLYTREHFRNVKRILSRDGVLLTWLPTNIGVSGTASILKNLTETFRYVQLFYPTYLVGREMFAISFDGPRDLLSTQKAGLDRIAAAMASDPDLPLSPGYFWSRWLADDAAVRALVGAMPDVAPHAEDRPMLEYYVSIRNELEEKGKSILTPLLERRDTRSLAASLTASDAVRADWIASVGRYAGLEARTREYLSAPSAERLALVRKEFPDTNLARLLGEIEKRRQGRGVAARP